VGSVTAKESARMLASMATGINTLKNLLLNSKKTLQEKTMPSHTSKERSKKKAKKKATKKNLFGGKKAKPFKKKK